MVTRKRGNGSTQNPSYHFTSVSSWNSMHASEFHAIHQMSRTAVTSNPSGSSSSLAPSLNLHFPISPTPRRPSICLSPVPTPLCDSFARIQHDVLGVTREDDAHEPLARPITHLKRTLLHTVLRGSKLDFGHSASVQGVH